MTFVLVFYDKYKFEVVFLRGRLFSISHLIYSFFIFINLRILSHLILNSSFDFEHLYILIINNPDDRRVFPGGYVRIV